HRIYDEREPVISAIPATSDYRLHTDDSDTPDARLSRFAFIRRDGNQIVLESPTACARILLHDPQVIALLWTLWRSDGTKQVTADDQGFRADILKSVVNLLWNAGFLAPLDPASRTSQDEAPPQLYWEFHDLLFHSRSRFGRHRYPYGATYPLEGCVAPPPAIK